MVVVPLALVTLEVVVLLGVMTVVTAVDPECTPTTLILEVSTTLSKAAKLLIKVVSLLLLKNSVIFKEK